MRWNAREDDGTGWKKFQMRHLNIIILSIAVGIIAIVGAIYIFWWYAGDAQSTGLVPSILSLWTVGNIVSFILHLIFWEFIFIGIPLIIAAAIGWQWWKRLPTEERSEYHFFGRRSRRMRGGSGASFLLWVAFAIKIYLDGNWNVAISSWTFDYFVNSWISVLIWMAIIFGIPMVIGITWYLLHHKRI
jgi:hypothetical protein